jgi:AAA-like domain/TIR domain/CHAT domain
MKKILILTANPKNTDKLRLDEEVREIEEGLQRSRRRDQFEIISRWAVRPDDLRRALLDHEPQIVHFSGHGAGTDGLVLENTAGQMKLVSTQSLARLFKLFQNKVECVLLNACYSGTQAAAIHEHIDCVIGMNQAIGDQAAIQFAVGFYDGLGAGRSYQEAFEFGLVALDLEGISETATPQINQREPGVNRDGAGMALGLVSAPVMAPAEPVAEVVTKVVAMEVVNTPVPEPIPQPLTSTSRARIFISYKRGAEPDEPVAMAVYQALSQTHDVFIDQAMTVGTPWVERIALELNQADFLIIFLSARSVQSEMVLAEVEKAHQLYKTAGKPALLPVRLAYANPFVYPLSAYLNPINWAIWEDLADTSRLIEELQQAIAGAPLSIATETAKRKLTVVTPNPAAAAIPQPRSFAQPLSLEPAEGTMDAESQFYIERDTDLIALSTIQRQGVTLTIKGPRQMGKSSLLMRTIDASIKVGKQFAYIDFGEIEQDILNSADRFYRQFCCMLTERLNIPDQVADYWLEGSGNIQRCTRYMQNHVLKTVDGPLVLAMDEVDKMFDADYRSDFFSMLRSWHNNRALPMYRMWKQFDLALVTATEPYHLIANLNQSPFNVGEVILLCDFTAKQVSDLNQRHGAPLTPAQEQQLMDLLHGHPYLIRRSLYLIASQQLSLEALLERATREDGPFGDHLRHHLFRIYDKPDLVQGLLGAIRTQTCPDERIARLLIAAGLVRREEQQVVPRCQLYANYFGEHLNG